jgi:L-lactate permease
VVHLSVDRRKPLPSLPSQPISTMFKSMFSANAQGPERKNVIAAIIAMAIVVLILWLFVVLLRP